MVGLKVETFPVDGLRAVIPEVFKDDRGSFSETFSLKVFHSLGIEGPFVQDNLSLSVAKGTLRGLHFQIPPGAQGKLVRVLRGSIWDVAVDLRRSSPTFGQHVSVLLSRENAKQFWIPIGFAHGFCTLEPDTEVLYKVTGYYSKDCERGLAWDDPDLALSWPLNNKLPRLSKKDKTNPRFKDLPTYFP